MSYEKSDGHFTRGDERGPVGEEAEGDGEAGDDLDDAGDDGDRRQRSAEAFHRRPSQNLLRPVKKEHQAGHDAKQCVRVSGETSEQHQVPPCRDTFTPRASERNRPEIRRAICERDSRVRTTTGGKTPMKRMRSNTLMMILAVVAMMAFGCRSTSTTT